MERPDAVTCRDADGRRLFLCVECHARAGTEVVEADAVAPVVDRLATCSECGRALRIAGSGARRPLAQWPVNVIVTDAPDGPARWQRAYRIILDAARRRTEQAKEQGIDNTRPCV